MTQDQIFHLRFVNPKRYVTWDDLDPQMFYRPRNLDFQMHLIHKGCLNQNYCASTSEDAMATHEKLASQFIKANMEEPEFHLVCVNLSGRVIWSNDLPKVGVNTNV